jgi:hypothetical protein
MPKISRSQNRKGISEELSETLRINPDKLSKTLSMKPENLVKHEVETSQNTKKFDGTPYNKEIIIESNIYNNILSFWNLQKITVHKKLLPEMETAIKSALKNYSTEEITQSISNYSDILKGDEYFFKYRWTLKDFLKRGVDKFLDGDIAKQNYLKDNGGNGHGRISGQMAARNEKPTGVKIIE